jgi:hypothetical protein
MPIINSLVPYLAPRDNIEYRKIENVFLNDHFKNYHYYLVEYANKYCLVNLHKAIPENILQDIKSGKIILMLYHWREANVNVIEPIYQYAVIKLGIPEEFIEIYTESPTIKTTIKEVASKLGKKILRCFNTNLFENDLKQTLKTTPELKKNLLVTLENKIYTKKFLNFNRRWRLHRPCLVAHMCLEGILDKGFISLGPCEDKWGWDHSWSAMLSAHKNYPDIGQRLLNNKDLIFSIPNLYLDQSNLSINHYLLTPSTLDLYRNTYFSVVTETNFFFDYEPALFLTEKIFKPIANMHPFIVLGRPKTLSYLKDLGYKTFDNIIDESYDEETEDILRMMMIIKEIKRLCNLSTNELEQFLFHAKEVCEYNYELIMSKNNFIRDITDDTRY